MPWMFCWPHGSPESIAMIKGRPLGVRLLSGAYSQHWYTSLCHWDPIILEPTGILVTAHKSSSILYFDWRHISKVFFKEKKKAMCKKAIYTICIAYFLWWISPGHQEETGLSHASDLYGDNRRVIVMVLLSGLHRMKAQNGLCYFQDLAFRELTYSFRLFINNNEEQILPCEIWCLAICIKRLFLGGIFCFINKLF